MKGTISEGKEQRDPIAASLAAAKPFISEAAHLCDLHRH